MDKILRGLATAQAKRYGVNPKLVAALVSVESGWEPWAFRYEPHYLYLYKTQECAIQGKVSHASEVNFQKTSFGLMQVMGAVAREAGLTGSLARLFVPEVNLEHGCKLLATLAKRYAKLEDQIAAYNAGSAKSDALTGEYRNQSYVDKVLRAY